MQLTSTWRTRIYGTAAAIIGTFLAVQVAHEKFMWPIVITGVVLAIGIAHLQKLRLSTLLLGAVIFGYIVGNRGFAQLSLLAHFPLLPAELVLLVGGVIFLVASALRREPPVRRDALNVLILLWMVVSSFRLYGDIKVFGLIALRDYATVYYASFFFLAQWVSNRPEQRQFLHRSVFFGCAALVIVFPLFTRFPELFLDWLVVRGTPLVHFKGDLAGTFMAVGAVLFFLRFDERRSWWSLALSLALSSAVLTSNSRASMLGLVVAIVTLAFAGRWRFALAQMLVAAGAALLILLAAQWRNQSWEQTPLHGVYERVVSITDPHGLRTYSGPETFNKGDNNLFRSVWWQVCIDETIANDPWFGVGWGYDLAEPFVRVYYPDTGDDFVTRSPHNILITIFARTGVAGLIPFIGVLAVIGRRTWHAARAASPAAAGLWCSCCVILTSACLGVVLEGPMGAVVFWSLLGLANSETIAADRAEEATDTLDDLPAFELPSRGEKAVFVPQLS